MIKRLASQGLRISTLGLLFPMFLVFGCSSTSQPERPIEAASGAESQGVSLHSEKTAVAEQKAVAEVDEKNSIFFSLGSSSINQQGRDKLQHIASLLKSNKGMSVTLNGYANDNGSSSFNLAVADARVERVSSVLKKYGVKTRQIKKRVIGGEKISGACKSEECRRKMRRVELVISPAP